jgi:hypothetical protein
MFLAKNFPDKRKLPVSPIPAALFFAHPSMKELSLNAKLQPVCYASITESL